MGLSAVVYIGGLVLLGDAAGTVVYRWLGMLTMCLPTAVCWLAVLRVGFRHREVLLAAAAVTAFAAGNIYYFAMVAAGGSLPFPCPGDVGYLLFYPLMLAAVVVHRHRHVRGLASSVWLDSAVGSLGAASVLAVVLSPVLASALMGSMSLATAVAVAYPMVDLLLVAAIAGIVALQGVRMGRMWSLLIAGLVVFTAADVVYALQVTADTYVVGTPLDAGWAIGLALMAMWVDGAAEREQSAKQELRPATAATALAVSSVATAAGLAVLIAGTRVHLSTLAVALAGVTLLAAAARSQLAFRLLAVMANLRRRAAITAS